MSDNNDNEPTATTEVQEGEQITILHYNTIDLDAPGSREPYREWQRLYHAVGQARADLFDAESDRSDALAAWQADESNKVLRLEWRKANNIYLAAEKAFLIAQERIEEFYISRMTTSDGSDVREAVKALSLSSFEALVQSDIKATIVPKLN